MTYQVTKSDLKAIKTINRKNAAKKYKIKLENTNDYAVIDNHQGLGASEVTREAFYRGFIAPLYPADFQKLTSRPMTIFPEVLEKIKNGYAVANPIFYVDIENFVSSQNGYPKVLDVENFDIAASLIYLGCKIIPTQFSFVGYRSYSVKGDSRFYDWMNERICGMSDDKGKSHHLVGIFHRFIVG